MPEYNQGVSELDPIAIVERAVARDRPAVDPRARPAGERVQNVARGVDSISA